MPKVGMCVCERVVYICMYMCMYVFKHINVHLCVFSMGVCMYK